MNESRQKAGRRTPEEPDLGSSAPSASEEDEEEQHIWQARSGTAESTLTSVLRRSSARPSSSSLTKPKSVSIAASPRGDRSGSRRGRREDAQADDRSSAASFSVVVPKSVHRGGDDLDHDQDQDQDQDQEEVSKGWKASTPSREASFTTTVSLDGGTTWLLGGGRRRAQWDERKKKWILLTSFRRSRTQTDEDWDQLDRVDRAGPRRSTLGSAPARPDGAAAVGSGPRLGLRSAPAPSTTRPLDGGGNPRAGGPGRDWQCQSA